MPYNEFKEIFTSLFNGSVSQAENITENYSDEYNTNIVLEEWEKSQLERKRYICNVLKNYDNNY